MSRLLKKLFKRKSFKLNRDLPFTEIPPPKLIETAHLYDYLDATPIINTVEREYMFAVMRFKESKEQLRRLEDEQFQAVLEGRVTADDSFNFTDRYRDMQRHVKRLDWERRNLRQKVKEARRSKFPVQRSTVHYPPI